jgi:hypothetical protein
LHHAAAVEGGDAKLNVLGINAALFYEALRDIFQQLHLWNSRNLPKAKEPSSCRQAAMAKFVGNLTSLTSHDTYTP